MLFASWKYISGKLTKASRDPSPELALLLLFALCVFWGTCGLLLQLTESIGGGNGLVDMLANGPELETPLTVEGAVTEPGGNMSYTKNKVRN